MSCEQIIEVWKTLPPAPLKELNGHYIGLVPNAGDKTRQASTTDYMYNDSTLVDEVRKPDDYVYLGVGTRKTPDGKRSEPGHFILLGPTDEWVGVDDVKAARK